MQTNITQHNIIDYNTMVSVSKVNILFYLFLLSVCKDCYLPTNTNCPNINDLPKECDRIHSTDGIIYTCPIELKRFNDVFLTTGKYYDVTIFANRIELASIRVDHNLVITINQKLIIAETSELHVGQKMILAYNWNQSLTISNIYIKSSRLLMYFVSFVKLNNVTIQAQYTECTSEDHKSLYPDQFLSFHYQNQKISLKTKITNSIPPQPQFLVNLSMLSTIGIYTLQTIQIQTTLIQGSHINIVSKNLIVSQDSTITAEGMGCRNDKGLGKGIQFNSHQRCSSTGASSSGYGGMDCIDYAEYFSFILHRLPYGNKLNPLVTGSSGSTPLNASLNIDAAGGGIILIRTSEYTILNGSLRVNGNNALPNPRASGGSGGTINIVSYGFIGSGQISAQGGLGIESSGDGSGGWIKYLSIFESNFNGQVKINSSKLDLSSRAALADDGNLVGSFCSPGYHQIPNKLQCSDCNQSSYKPPLSPKCKECPNKDIRISSSKGKVNSSECILFSKKKFWYERSPIQFLIDYSVYRIIILFSLIVLFVTLGFLLFKNFKRKKFILEKQGFDFNKVIGDLNQNNIITDSLRNDKGFKMGDLPYHVHRITVFGTNSPQNPWKISSKLPFHLNQLLIADSFQDFTKTFNKKAKWKLIEEIILYLSTLIYPIYWYLLVKFKKIKYRNVCRLMESAMLNFVQPSKVEGKHVLKAKLSKSTDYTLCYIDIFNYYKADLKYFKLESPYLVHLSGEGSFIRSYYLCDADPFLNALFMIINRNISSRFIDDRFKIIDNLVSHAQRIQNSAKLVEFIRYFNRTSRTLDLGSTKVRFINEIIKLIQFIHKWNDEFFINKKIKLSLVMMITYFKREKVSDYQVNILENNNIVQFKKFMMATLDNLQKSNSSDLKFALFVYNPERDISQFIQESEIQVSPFELQLVEKNDQEWQSTFKNKRMSKKTIKNKIINVCSSMRYLLISHKPAKLSKYTLRLFLALLVLMNASIITIWEQDYILYPYVSVNLVAPFVGVIWLASGISYGVGKMFIVLNVLSIVNNLIVLIQSVIGWNESSTFYKVMRLLLVLIQIATSELGCQMITSSKKLNQPKVN